MSLCAKNPVASENVPSYERRGSPEQTERGAVEGEENPKPGRESASEPVSGAEAAAGAVESTDGGSRSRCFPR